MISSNVNGVDGDASISKANALLHELLDDDDDGAAIQQHNNGDEASTTMSSVLGPILFRANANSTRGVSIAADAGERVGLVLQPSKQSHPSQQQQQQAYHDQQQEDEVDEFHNALDDEDTYMTKPREISFDMHSDDVSALFGGNCGASTTGGMGGGHFHEIGAPYGASNNAAQQRKNRQRGLRQWQNQQQQQHHNQPQQDRSGRHARQQTRGGVGPTVHHPGGVDSILEEIGFRPSSSKKHEGLDECSSGGKEKGHWSRNSSSHRWSSHQRSSSARISTSRYNNGNSIIHWVMEWKTIVFDRIRSTMRMKYWITLLVGIMYLSVQFRTVRDHDRETLDHLNWRFQNHHHRRHRPSVELSDVMRRIAAEEGERGLQSGYNEGGMKMEMEFLKEDEDGLVPGDASRKNMPQISKHHALERNDMLLDDDFDFTKNGGNSLRGGGSGGGVDRPLQGMQQQNSMQQLPTQQQLGNRMMGNEIQPQIQQQEQQQQPPLQQQSQQQDGSMPNENNSLAGDTHPLLQPKQGLSMADALAKLGTDKLSDIDPRPQQLLSNDIIPPRFRAFADVKTAHVLGRDTPFFWHVPRSGGVVVKTMLSHCLNQTLAAEVGEMDGHQNDSELKVISFSEHKYVNVNVATPEGIRRALNLGLVPSHLADTIVSAHVDLVTALFNADDRARAFVLFRHPVDRAASMFYFLKASGYPPLKEMTVDDYAKSEYIENNWLVRMLSESMTGPIDMDNLEIAKEVLRRKFIVGLLDNKRGSFARFDHYFKWKESPNYEKEFGCRKQLMDEKYVTKHPVRKDSDTWKLLLEQNRFDVHLYDFAKELFSQQSYIFGL